MYWPEAQLVVEPDPRVGPVLITIAYTVPPERQDEFLKVMAQVRGSRRRTGAIRWGLFRDGESEHRFVEVYQVASWDEHLRQHDGRYTETDRETEKQALALIEGEPEVHHLLPPDP